MKTTTTLIIAAIAGTVGAVLIVRASKATAASVSAAAGKVLDAVNPLSDQNLAYKGANAVTQALTGDPWATFGTWLYDVTRGRTDPKADATVVRVAGASVDLGTYADTAARDDAEINKFGYDPFGASMREQRGWQPAQASVYDLAGPVLP